MKKAWLLPLTLLILLTLFTFAISADVGNSFADDGGGVDAGGNYDYSDDDYDSTNTSSGDSELTAADIPILIGIIVIIGAVFVVTALFSSKKQKAEGAKMASKEAEVIKAVQVVDPAFTADSFKTFVADAFIRVQEAWESKNWAVVRPFESDKLFRVHERQLQEYIDAQKTNFMNEQNIKSTLLTSFCVDGLHEILLVKLNATLLDYTIDDRTQEVLNGSKTQRCDRMYRLEFVRTKGVKTDDSKKMATQECPSCGAPTEVSNTGRCDYCKNVITSGEYGWVLNEYTKWQ